jgi:tRNA pseudouridine13 synthase
VKVKQRPDDFVVEERARIEATDRGTFAVYRLKKRGIGTIEALRAIRRAWRVPARATGFGGLKDRHGATTQWVTIARGPRRNLDQPAFRLTYEGQSPVPMSRTLLLGNRFRIRLRDLSREEAQGVAAGVAAAAGAGLPNYFDDQRFGSLRGGQGFAMRHLLRGDPEAALRAVIAAPSREDRANVRARKEAIRRGWGDWASVLPTLDGSPMRDAIARLAADPHDFLGALAALDREERRILASAWQSSVWNRALVLLLEARLPRDERRTVPGAAGPMIFPRDEMPVDLREASMPLPAAEAFREGVEEAPLAALRAALSEDGLRPEDLRPPPRLGMDLRPTRRPLAFRPEDATASAPVEDDLNPGRFAVDVAFTLGRGQYATLVLKRLTHGFERKKRRRGGRRRG